MPKNRLLLDADLSSRVLDIIDAGPFIGYSPERLDREGGSGAIERGGGTPRVLPDAPLRLEASSRFDANVKYKVRRVRAESFPISNSALTPGLDRSLLKLSPLTFDMAGGFFSSDIEINARRRPVQTRYDIRLAPTPMGRLLRRWGAVDRKRAAEGKSGSVCVDPVGRRIIKKTKKKQQERHNNKGN